MVCGASLSNGKTCQNKVSTGERCWRHKNLPADASKPKAAPKVAKPKAAPKVVAKVAKSEKPKTPTKPAPAKPKAAKPKIPPKTKASKPKAAKPKAATKPATVKRIVVAKPKSSSKSESPKEKIVWKSTKKGDTITYTAFHNGKAISYVDMVDMCLKDTKILEEFVECVKEISSNTPPFMLRFPEFPSEEAFRFLVTPNAHLNYAPDPKPFQEHFSDEEVAVFENISKDCLLVVPKPPGDFAHLQSFSKEASFKRQVRFWKMVFTQLRRVSKGRKVWLNTHGLGVHWLHVRLDFEPKYYPTAEKPVPGQKKQENSLEEALIKFGKPKYPETVTKRNRTTTKTIDGREMNLIISRLTSDVMQVFFVSDKPNERVFVKLVYYKDGKWSLVSSSYTFNDVQYDYRAAIKEGGGGRRIKLKGHPEHGQKPPKYILEFFDPN